jgi:hypothetical protein
LLTAASALPAGCLGRSDESGPSENPWITDSPTPGDTPTPVPTQAGTPRVDGDTVVFDGGGGPAFAEALNLLGEEPGRTLRLEPGTYRVGRNPPESHPNLHGHFGAIDFQDATIDGNGATLIFTDPTQGGFRFYSCDNLTLKNLTVDYDPLPHTQGTIVETADGGRTLTIEIDDGFVSLDHRIFDDATVWATIHDAETGNFVQETRANGSDVKRFETIERTGEGTYRLTLTEQTPAAGLETGRRLVVNARQGGPCFEFGDCANPVVENVTVHASTAWTFHLFLCANPVVRGVSIELPEDADRSISSNADGIHFNNCWDGPVAEDCYMERMEDDAVVVDMEMLPIDGIVDERTVSVGYGQTTYVDAGDVMEAISAHGERRGELSPVESVETGRGVRLDRHPRRPMEITFEEPLPDALTADDYLLNTATANHDYVVRNNEMRNNRARPIRVSSSEGVIEGNTIDGCNGAAIVLEANSGHQLPKGWVENVTVRNNTIRNAGLVNLAWNNSTGILCEARTGPAVRGRPNRNVEIVGNDIERTASAGIEVADTDGLTIENNSIADPNRLEFAGQHYGFVLRNDADITVGGNTVTGPSSLQGFGRQSECENLTVESNELVVDGSQRDATIEDTGSDVDPESVSGPAVSRLTQPAKANFTVLQDATVAVERAEDAGRTRYEVAVPWEAVMASPEDDAISVSLLVNDNDGEGRLGWVEWASGLGGSKNPAQFRAAALVEDGESTDDWPIPRQSITPDGSLEGPPDRGVIDLDESGSIVQKGDNPPSVGGRAWLSWDDDHLYLSADLEDDTHAQSYGIQRAWRGDSIQLGVTAGAPGDRNAFSELTIAEVP